MSADPRRVPPAPASGLGHRRRALLLGGLALVLGGLAAANVAGREAALERRVGGLVDVVVAQQPIRAGARIRASALAVRRVPLRFAPADRPSAAALTGLRAAVPIARGTDLHSGLIADAAAPARPLGPPLPRGERAAAIVALGSPSLIAAGSRVDVVVTPEPSGRDDGVAQLALEDVEVLSAQAAAAGDGAANAAPGPRVAATLRVTVRQAVYLAAAQDFARELRLLARPPGDRRRGRAGLRLGVGG